MGTKFFLAAAAATALLSSATFTSGVSVSGGGKSTITSVKKVEAPNAVFTQLINNSVLVKLLTNAESEATIAIYNADKRLVLREDFANASKVNRKYNFSQLLHGKYTIEVKTVNGVQTYPYWR